MNSTNKKLPTRYLLDTCTFLWWMESNKKLPQKITEKINDYQHEIFVSVASLWEMTIKASLGKLIMPKNVNLAQSVQQAGFKLLDIKAHHIEKLAALSQYHKDPFDHLLICQTQAESLTLISHDKTMKKYLKKAQLLSF